MVARQAVDIVELRHLGRGYEFEVAQVKYWTYPDAECWVLEGPGDTKQLFATMGDSINGVLDEADQRGLRGASAPEPGWVRFLRAPTSGVSGADGP